MNHLGRCYARGGMQKHWTGSVLPLVVQALSFLLSCRVFHYSNLKMGQRKADG